MVFGSRVVFGAVGWFAAPFDLEKPNSLSLPNNPKTQPESPFFATPKNQSNFNHPKNTKIRKLRKILLNEIFTVFTSYFTGEWSKNA